MVLQGVDRQQALKQRHRAAILIAARALIDERNGPHFSVDELADRAGVARRTVFNHFGSSSGVVLALAEEVISVRIRDFLASTPTAHGSEHGRAQMFRVVSETMRVSDLSPAVAAIHRILAGVSDLRAQQLTEEAFTRVAAGLCEALLRVDPTSDPLDAELLVGALMSGITVIARRWVALPGDRSTAAAREEWDALLERCIESLGTGYAS